jgi:hypothetical protein
LGQRTPASLFTASPRAYPRVIRPWDYPADHHVRRVIGDGHVRWRDRTLYLSAALHGQQVALAQQGNRVKKSSTNR